MPKNTHTLKIAPPDARPNKYHAIAQTIKDRIMSGEATHKLPSVTLMAEEFSVTTVTMQKALNLLKEDGCIVAIPGKGCFITRLKRPRTHTIGSVISSAGPLGISLTNGIQDQCSKLGQSILVENYGYRKRLGLTRIQRIMEREQVDGFIIWPDDRSEDINEIIDYLKEVKIPYVLAPLVDFQQFRDSTTVTNVDIEPAADLMTHLVSNGYKKIGYAISKQTPDADYALSRHKQYKRSLKVSGLEAFEPILIDENPPKSISAKTVKQLKELDAIFCVTDRIAIPIIKACLQHRISVPNDLAIAAFGNTEFAQLLELTSVEQNFRKIGEQAVNLLLEEIEGKRTGPAHTIIESELVIRQSSIRTD